jgi:hypothetical protein
MRPTSWVLGAAIVGAVNAILAATLVSEPGRAADLLLVHDWCTRWLKSGEDLYASIASEADYPPNAIVMLSPIALIPADALALVWAPITLALTFVFAYLVVRFQAPHAASGIAAVPMLLFLCWGGVRMLLQFTRLTAALTYAAVRFADSRPFASGILLGAALTKPQISGPIALWMFLTMRWRPVLVAIAVVAVACAVYIVRADTSVPAVIAGWTAIMSYLYSDPTSPTPLIGRTSIRGWTYALAGEEGNILWIAGAAVLLTIPCFAAVVEARRRVARAEAAVPALFCLWSLLVWFHLGNNLVLMFPAFAFLLLLDDPATAVPRYAVAAVMQIQLMLDVPVHLPAYADRLGPLNSLVVHADRLLVLGTFFYLARLWYRLRQTSPASVPATAAIRGIPIPNS